MSITECGSGRGNSGALLTVRVVTGGLAIVMTAATAGCTAQMGHGEGSPNAPASESGRLANIQQLTPARDSVGSAPTRFAWTPVQSADAYAIGIWNEVDVLLWRADDVRTPSVTLPADLRLEPGTYLWSVTALREKQAVGESGLAAFVVR